MPSKTRRQGKLSIVKDELNELQDPAQVTSRKRTPRRRATPSHAAAASVKDEPNSALKAEVVREASVVELRDGAETSTKVEQVGK